MPGRNQQGDYRYAYQGQEKDPETGWEAFELRMYDGRVGRWMTTDPYSQYHSPYLAMGNNPVKMIDPDGGRAFSTDVLKNVDGTYTVVNAYNDGDNNIYVVDVDGNRTGDIIGTTMKPYDFMSTNDKTGEFTFKKKVSGVTFSLDNLTVTGTVKPNEHTEATIYDADAQKLLDWGMELFNNEVKRQAPMTFYGSLEILREMSANDAPLDFKNSLGLRKYTPIKAGNTSDGKPIITTLRAVGNMTFGANMRSTKPYFLGSSYWYYSKVMVKVGAYNQSQNKGNGYNSGFPYFGEHTYSGSYIYYGFFGKFYGSM